MVASLPQPPVLIGHSFGGLIAQKYVLGMDVKADPDGGGTVREGPPFPFLSGVAFLCSVPPSGNKELVGRFIRRDAMLAAKVTWCADGGGNAGQGSQGHVVR